jgi:hypothetical protein
MFWFGASAALVSVAIRIPIIVPLEFRATSPSPNPPLTIACLSAAIVALGAGVGALLGRTIAAACIVFVAVALYVFLYRLPI